MKTATLINMFLQAYGLFFLSLASSYGKSDDRLAQYKSGDVLQLSKILDLYIKETERETQEESASLRKTSKLLNDLMAKLKPGISFNTVHDVAQGKKAEQSSTYPPDFRNFSAGSAVDGISSTSSHTKNETKPSWWVDLGQEYTIGRIEVINREHCCGERFHDVDVKIGTTLKDMKLCHHYKGPGKTGEHITLNCTEPIVGRFVKLTITRGQGYLQIGELKAMAYKKD